MHAYGPRIQPVDQKCPRSPETALLLLFSHTQPQMAPDTSPSLADEKPLRLQGAERSESILVRWRAEVVNLGP